MKYVWAFIVGMWGFGWGHAYASVADLPAFDYQTACPAYAAALPAPTATNPPSAKPPASSLKDGETINDKYKKDCIDRNAKDQVLLYALLDRIDDVMSRKCDNIARYHIPYYYVSFFDCVHHAIKVIDKARR